MTHADKTPDPSALDDSELDSVTGGFEAWPSKVTGPQLKSDSDAMMSQERSSGDLKAPNTGPVAGPLIAKSLCNNEVIE